MKILFSLLVIIGLAVLGKAHASLDSLRTQLHASSNAEEQLDILRKLAYHSRARHVDTALMYSRNMVNLAISVRDTQYIIGGWRGIAKTYLITQSFDSAAFYYQKVLGFVQQHGNSKAAFLIARSYNDLGWLKLERGHWEEAAALGLTSLEEGGNGATNKNRVRSHTLMGVALRTSVEKVYDPPYPKEAEQRLQKALESLKQAYVMSMAEQSFYASSVAINLANTYGMLDNYEQGLFYLMKADSLKDVFGDNERAKATVKLNKALMLSKLGRYEEALAIREELAEYLTHTTDENFLYRYFYNLSGILMDLSMPAEAVQAAQEALQKASNIGDLSQVTDATKRLAKAQTEAGSYDTAAITWRQAMTLTDSTNQVAIQKNVDDIVARYETQLKEEEIERLNLANTLAQENASQKSWLARRRLEWLVGLGIIAALLVLLLMSAVQRARTRQALAENRLEAEANALELLRANLRSELRDESHRLELALPGKAINEYLLSPLTERETEVLDLLADGHSNKEISDRLCISPNTCKTHVAHIYEKLDVNNRTQAAQKAGKLKLLERLNRSGNKDLASVDSR